MGGPADEAFAGFVASCSRSLMQLAYLMTGRRTDAEDAVQGALLKVYLAWPRIEHAEAAAAYARKTLVREVATVRRGPLRRVLVTDRVPEMAVLVEPDVVETRELLHVALLRLPPRQRAVIVLRYFADLTERETAEVLGVRIGTVKQHAARGLARLRDELSSEAQESP